MAEGAASWIDLCDDSDSEESSHATLFNADVSRKENVASSPDSLDLPDPAYDAEEDDLPKLVKRKLKKTGVKESPNEKKWKEKTGGEFVGSAKRIICLDEEDDVREFSEETAETEVETISLDEYDKEQTVGEISDIYGPLSSDEEENVTEFFKDFPIFSRKIGGYGAAEIIDVLMKVDNYTQYVCPTVPLQCEENATFLVDTDKLRKFSDLTVDDNGLWKRPSGSNLYLTKTERGYKSSRQITQSYDFQLRKSYYVHAGTPDFHKIVYTIRNSEGHNLRHAIIQYYFQDGKVVPVLKNVPHGNSKKEHPFIRTKPSAIAEMKNKSVYMQPKKVVADVFNEKGGSLNFKSPSDIPRDRTQIYNINRSNPRKYQTGGKCTTNFDAIIKMSVEGNFARSFEMKENGHARCFLATDQQLLDVKKFCCNSDSILGIDPTFDLGGFYLTCTTYRHPMFVIRDSGRHPLLLGPCMMHLKRETSDYEYFGKTLSGYIKDDVVNVWGSDGEKALINGLQKSNAFQGIHLICEIHARENCERKLKSLNFKEPHINLFLNEIYGQQHGNKRIGGLIDCETEADFDSSLINLGRKWDAIEVTETGRKPPEFFTWFKKFKAEECKRNLLKPIRTAAGLGFPPIRYTNNNNEAINSVLKREVDYKKQSWENMAVSLQNIIHTQYQELEKGVFNVGEYRLHKDYNHLSVSTLNWSQLNKDQKQDKLAKVFRYNAEFTELPTHHIPSVLSETYNSLTGTIYKAHELRDVWRKAGLLAGDKSIFTKLSSNKTCIDCSENVYIVEGNEEMDWFTCTCTGSHKCQNFDKFGVFCEHTIAASEFRGSLQKYIQEIKKCSEKVSLDALLEKHTKKSGKKGSRKGKNDPHTRPVITSSVPLFTEPFHNEDEFEVNFLKDEKRAKRCAACGVDFPKSVVVQPFDLVMQHPERYLYPQKNQGETEWVYTAQKKRATFYHCAPECILKRHPHFTIDKIKIPENVRSKLKPCHIKMLQSHFNMDL